MLRLLLVMLLYIFSFQIYALAPARLIGLEIKPSKQQTQFIFILNKKIRGTIKNTPASHMVTIEFENTHKYFSIKNLHLSGTIVKYFKLEEVKPAKLRFIFFVKSHVDCETKFLPSSQTNVKLQLTIKSKSSKPAIHIKQKIIVTEKIIKKIAPSKTQKIFTVVIDPGHGGKDAGAVGKRGTLEKNIVLAISKQLNEKINRHSRSIRAILTRHDDYFIPLRKRLDAARKADADLFIAIHADAYFNHAKGASVYALSQRGATSEAARWLARQDNYSELGEVEFKDLHDRSLVLRSVLIDLAQTATIRDSLLLGNHVLDKLEPISSLHYSQVEQAPFVVLKSPDIPSILVETGFITNPKEELRLRNADYQKKIAHAIYQGILEYIKVYNAKHASLNR